MYVTVYVVILCRNLYLVTVLSYTGIYRFVNITSLKKNYKTTTITWVTDNYLELFTV